MHRAATRIVPSTSYVLTVEGEQDEYGVGENVFRFEATLAGREGRLDLCTMHGFVIDHEGRSDLCVEVSGMKEPTVHCKPVRIVPGAQTGTALGVADVRAHVSGRKLLVLFNPIVNDINQELQPGTRLISALQRHFSDRGFDVVVDLGTEEEDVDFNDYFLPDLDLFDLERLSSRLLVGRWGNSAESTEPSFEFGIVYS